jgi:hypothetical protein
MLAYKISMQTFVLQIARIMECSDTNTHLLPDVLSAIISGVNAAISSSDIKLEPPPDAIWLKATHKIVYHITPFAIT